MKCSFKLTVLERSSSRVSSMSCPMLVPAVLIPESSEMVGDQSRCATDNAVFRCFDFVEISYHLRGDSIRTGFFCCAIEVEAGIRAVAFRLLVVTYCVKLIFAASSL